ncbi:TnsA-like heteromeric transposase endonuclease subunit [Nonomuraea basaltis]|uniref:TnsA-like heteromeric transposase endonuclease subunit n=1 Tax=Nonomuraea basaltis TaxID=2495887 RepID=UPI00110C4BDA|nr:TnsA-like heteromeric transposase endonuclease subunit [Nonomuraea basaltis]TMR88172.1 TnsA-like heteromeric transposase endonuclease subunit [Nonomuraea basaltis]
MKLAADLQLRSVQVRYLHPDGQEERCSLEDAAGVAFENCSAIRRIPRRADQAHTPSTHWSSTTNRMIDCESHLESVWMTLLDFDQEVSGFSGQPMQLFGVDDRGTWKATPDLFVRRLDGSATVMEVKNPGRLADTRVRAAAERVAACCAVAGWGYELVGEPPERQRTINVLTLAGYRREMAGVSDYRTQLMALAGKPVPLGQLVSFTAEPLVARAVVLHLCWTGELAADLSRPLEDTTLVWAASKSSDAGARR